MSELLLQPTTVASWHVLVNEAELACNLELGDDLESYLVFLLMRFTDRPDIGSSIVAIEFLESLNTSGVRQSNLLQDVGDKCLLFSGLFSEHAKRRRVTEHYFTDLGQNAFYALANLSQQQFGELYGAISEDFLLLRDVLKAMRQEDENLFRIRTTEITSPSIHSPSHPIYPFGTKCTKH